MCAAAWLTADVQINFAGHLSGLFYTGTNVRLPGARVGDHTWRVRDNQGYDGEFYHLIAHDPLNRRGFLDYVDSARYRWRRIGLPGLAYLLAVGNDAYVDGMYVALQLGFVFLGAWWLARYAQTFGRHPGWGLGFLLIPSVAISLDRMTVDLPLAALTVALVLYAGGGTRDFSRVFRKTNATEVASTTWPVYAVLIAAPLIRETGLLLIVAWCVFRLIGRHLREAVFGAACAIPTLAWYLYVELHTIPDQSMLDTRYPFEGAIKWTLHALSNPVAVYGPRAAAAFELLALAGIWMAFVLAIRTAAQKQWDLPALLAVTFTLFASLIGYQDIWATAYGLARALSPLLIALAVIALRDRRTIFAMPLLLTVPRIALQFAAEIRVALHSAG